MTDTRSLTNEEYIAHMREKRGVGGPVWVTPNESVQCPQCGLYTAQISDGSRSCNTHGILRELRRGPDEHGPKRYVFKVDERNDGTELPTLWGPYAGSGSGRLVDIDEGRVCDHQIGFGDVCSKCGKSGKLIAMEGTDD